MYMHRQTYTYITRNGNEELLRLESLGQPSYGRKFSTIITFSFLPSAVRGVPKGEEGGGGTMSYIYIIY